MMKHDWYDEMLTSPSTFIRNAARGVITTGVSAVLALSMLGCSASTTDSDTRAATEATQVASTEVEAADEAKDESTDDTTQARDFSIDPTNLFSKRDLDASYDEASATKVALKDAGTVVDGDGVAVEGNVVTITAAGTYVLTGTLTSGRVVVDTPDTEKVQLVLDGATITSGDACALYVKSADKVFLTLAADSTNALAATGEAAEQDEHTIDGVVFASDDLTVNGAGSLSVKSAKQSGIVAKDELTLVDGKLTIEAADHAIQAKDWAAVKGGSYKLTAATDGIHVSHDTSGSKGFVYVAGGTFDITAGSDGIDASNDIRIDGGTFTISAGDDGIHSEYDLVVNDGTIDVPKSKEALEGARYEQNGGDVNVVATDDGVNASGEPSAADVQGASGQGKEQQRTDSNVNVPQEGAADAITPTEGAAPEEGGETPQVPGDVQGSQPQGGSEGQAPEADPSLQPQGLDGGQMMTPPEGFGHGGREGMRPMRMQGGPEGQQGPQDIQAPQGDATQAPQDVQTPQDTTETEGSDQQNAAPDGQKSDATGGRMGGGALMGGGMMDADETASLTINGGKLVVDAQGDGLDSNGTIVIAGGETYVSGPTNDGNGPLDYGTKAVSSGGLLVAVGSAGMVETFDASSTQGVMLVSATGSAGDTVELKDSSGKVLASYAPTKGYACVIVSAPGIEAGQTYTLTFGSQSKEVTMDGVVYSDVTPAFGGMMGGADGFGGRGLRENGTGAAVDMTQDTASA